MIEFRNVHYSIGDHLILSGVSFAVRRGETRVILGPSGSGKSTVLRLLMGLVQPDSGSIVIDGEDIAAVDEEQRRRIRRKMGVVFQPGPLFDSMTAGGNVGFSLLEEAEAAEAAVEGMGKPLPSLVRLEEYLTQPTPVQPPAGAQPAR